MLVSELIEKLSKMPQDARVILVTEARGNWDNEVRDVLYNGRHMKNAFEVHTVELDNWPPLEH